MQKYVALIVLGFGVIAVSWLNFDIEASCGSDFDSDRSF